MRHSRKYLDERDDLQAGCVPRSRDKGGLPVAELCNQFMDSKEALHANRDLDFCAQFGMHKPVLDLSRYPGKHQRVSNLTPADFEVLRGKLAKRFRAAKLASHV